MLAVSHTQRKRKQQHWITQIYIHNRHTTPVWEFQPGIGTIDLEPHVFDKEGWKRELLRSRRSVSVLSYWKGNKQKKKNSSIWTTFLLNETPPSTPENLNHLDVISVGNACLIWIALGLRLWIHTLWCLGKISQKNHTTDHFSLSLKRPNHCKGIGPDSSSTYTHFTPIFWSNRDFR